MPRERPRDSPNSLWAPPSCFEPFTCGPQQLGRRRQIPVSIFNLAVPKKRRKDRQVALDIGTVAVPAEQCLNREGMPQIVHPGTNSIARLLQPSRATDIAEALVGAADWPTALVNEEGWGLGFLEKGIPARLIRDQGFYGRGMQRD